MLLCLALLSFQNHSTNLAWYITAPTKRSDWEQLAALLVKSSFHHHAPSASTSYWMRWNHRLQKALSEQQTYQQYTQMARKMKGKKYVLQVVKDNDLDQKVLAVVEMGIRRVENTNHRRREDDKDDSYCSSSISTTSTSISRATIGFLCVDQQHRQQGIGRALVQRCENIAWQVRKEEQLHAEVDVENTLNFVDMLRHETKKWMRKM
jgi:ribosomal protein S18 acetylase RimI-like enzyme